MEAVLSNNDVLDAEGLDELNFTVLWRGTFIEFGLETFNDDDSDQGPLQCTITIVQEHADGRLPLGVIALDSKGQSFQLGERIGGILTADNVGPVPAGVTVELTSHIPRREVSDGGDGQPGSEGQGV